MRFSIPRFSTIMAFWMAIAWSAFAQGSYRVKFVLDGISSEEVPDLKGMAVYFSADERLVSYVDPQQHDDLSYMPSATQLDFNFRRVDLSFKTSENEFSSSSGSYSSYINFTNSESNKLYYRYYSPHFTDVQTGCVELIKDEYNTVYLHPLQNKKVIKVNPVKGRDGQVVEKCSFSANVDKAIWTHSGSGIEIGNVPYPVYAEKGTTLKYAIKPQNADCALAIRTLDVTNDDAQQTIDIDYSKAKKLRLYVSDSNGRYIKMVNPRLQNTYYADNCVNYGWGSIISQSLDFELKESADGSYNWLETYAIPDSKQNFEIYNVESWTTTDESFLFPYNCPDPFLVKEIAVTDDAQEQDVLMGKSDPRDVAFRLKGAASLADELGLKVLAYYDFKFTPFTERWRNAQWRKVSSVPDGDDLLINLKVSGLVPRLRISPKAESSYYPDNWNVKWMANAVNYEEEFVLPQTGVYTNQTEMDFSMVHAVKFVAHHGFFNKNKVFLHADCFETDESFTHGYTCRKSSEEAWDTITVYLAEGNYEWYAKSSSTGDYTSGIHSFQLDGETDLTIVADDATQPGTDVRLKVFDLSGVTVRLEDSEENPWKYDEVHHRLVSGNGEVESRESSLKLTFASSQDFALKFDFGADAWSRDTASFYVDGALYKMILSDSIACPFSYVFHGGGEHVIEAKFLKRSYSDVYCAFLEGMTATTDTQNAESTTTLYAQLDCDNNRVVLHYAPIQLPCYDLVSLHAVPEELKEKDLVVSESVQHYVPKSFADFFSCFSPISIAGLTNLSTFEATDLSRMFMNCSRLTSLDLTSFVTNKVENFTQMFQGCSELTTIYASWNFVVNARSRRVFRGCTKLVGAVPYDDQQTDYTMANYRNGYFKTYCQTGDVKHELWGEEEPFKVDELTLHDGEALRVAAPVQVAKVNYSRSLDGTVATRWESICLPYEIEAPENCKFYVYRGIKMDETANHEGILVLEGKDYLSAGQPAFFCVDNADAASVNFSATDRDVYPTLMLQGDSRQEADGLQMIGTFNTYEVSEGYVLKDNSMWNVAALKTAKESSKVSVEGLRAYLAYDYSQPTPSAKILYFGSKDNTGIEDVGAALNEGTAAIYDASGRRLPSLQRGLNIIRQANGKTVKVMVK